MIDHAIVEKVRISFGRCCLHADFFDKFYENFLAESPEIKQMFSHTDFAKQKQIIRESINFVIMYAKNENSHLAKTKLIEVGKTHSKKRMDVRPELYSIWVESLIKTIKQFEGSEFFNADLERDWRIVLSPAINLLSSEYDE